MFRYIAHPDYFLNTGVDLSIEKEKAIRKIAQCAKEHDVVLEVNLKGTKFGKRDYKQCLDSYLYPNTRVFEIIAEVGTKVCFGYDAHHPSALIERDIERVVYEKFKHLNLNFVKDLKL